MSRCLLIIFASLFSVSAFSAEKLNVVTTLHVLGDIASQIGGDLIEVKTLAEPNQDAHFVRPKPSLKGIASKADVFIEIGLSLELWADKVVGANPKIQRGKPGRIIASKGITTLEAAAASREAGDVHVEGNPHIWLDPLNAKIIARNIANGLSKADPKNKKQYAAKLQEFETNIDSKMAGWQEKAKDLKGKKVITYHKTLSYFAERFGLTVAGTIESVPGVSPGAKHRDELIEKMKSEKIDTIVQALYYDSKFASIIAQNTGARVAKIAIDVHGLEKAKDYFTLIDLVFESLLPTKS